MGLEKRRYPLDFRIPTTQTAVRATEKLPERPQQRFQVAFGEKAGGHFVVDSPYARTLSPMILG
jgi:hypothetical protein